MRQLFLAALGVLAVAGVASAQQPQPYRPAAPARLGPVRPASDVVVAPGGVVNGTPAVRGAFVMSGGEGCQTGQACNSGCGSLRSDLGFHFGSCKSFFSPCGPGLHGGHGHKHGCGHGGLFGWGNCPTLPFAEPWGKGFCCPPIYDSYAHH
jgi:hypothetical protein